MKIANRCFEAVFVRLMPYSDLFSFRCSAHRNSPQNTSPYTLLAHPERSSGMTISTSLESQSHHGEQHADDHQDPSGMLHGDGGPKSVEWCRRRVIACTKARSAICVKGKPGDPEGERQAS